MSLHVAIAGVWITSPPGGAVRESALAGWSVNPGREIITHSGAGWVRKVFEEAGQADFAMPFSVMREFVGAPLAAAQWIAQMASAGPPHPMDGTVLLLWVDGTNALQVTCIDCALTVQQVVPVGSVSVQTNYLLRGGHMRVDGIVAVSVYTPVPILDEDGTPMITETGVPMIME